MKSTRGNAVILIIFVVVGILYFAISDALKGDNPFAVFLPQRRDEPAIATSGVTIQMLPSDESSEVFIPSAPKPTPKSPAPRSEPEPKPEPEGPVPTPPAGFTVAELSPFFERVTIRSLKRPTNFFRGSFVLSASSLLPEPTSITGWRVVTNQNDPFVIPSGVGEYLASGYSEGDVMLDPRGSTTVYGKKSPFGPNIRLNVCTGYLNNVFPISPLFPKRCPAAIDRSEITAFSGSCQSFLRSIRTCEEPNTILMSGFREDDIACFDYMQDRFGYGSCYRAHRNDEDFFTDTWYVWLDDVLPFDLKHDRVLLYDTAGLLVDEYVY